MANRTNAVEMANRTALSVSVGMEMFRNTYLGLLEGKEISRDDRERAIEAFYMLEDTVMDFRSALKGVN